MRRSLNDKGSSRRAARPAFAVETLEGRWLLSQGTMGMMPLPVQHEVSALRASAQPSGTIRKSPHFYEFYIGPKRSNLDVVAASASVSKNGQTLLLTGTMQGRINTKPMTANDDSFFVFGINRGSPSEIAPFFMRPGIQFDSVVVASVTHDGGIQGSVVDILSGTTTPLPASAIRISGKMVRVTLSTSLLPTPPGGVPLRQYTFNLWPRLNLDMTPQPNNGSFVASFIPENGMAPIKTPASLHHTGGMGGNGSGGFLY
jgi:hypothetical protein